MNQLDTAQRRADSERLKAHELLKRICGIIPMAPEQRCARIDWLLEYAAEARCAALDEASKVVNIYNCDHNHGKKATKACDDIVEILDRLREGRGDEEA